MKLFLVCPLLRPANDGSRCSGLKRLKHMSIGGVRGAALPSEVGDRLVKNGVNSYQDLAAPSADSCRLRIKFSMWATPINTCAWFPKGI